jgi:UDP-N-acetylmuramate--alanine ligase
MSGIAEVLVNLGYGVSGSDQVSNGATAHLAELGARIAEGHRPEQVHGADVVVTSTAVGEDNVEVIEARRLAIPVIPRAEMLAELMRLKYGVAVAGAHGKTTTTAMIAEVLTGGGLDPTVVIGGRVGSLNSGAKLGRGEIMVAEADESDGSFLKMKPTIAVVTNIDREHLDHYAGLPAILGAFARFLARVPFYGAAVACIDEPNVRGLLGQLDRRVVTYGLVDEAQVRASEIEIEGFESAFTVHAGDRRLGRIRLRAPGTHTVRNALAAVAVGLELDVPFETIAGALAGFRGVDRRMQLRGEVGGIRVVDDYGHHPTEIVATLEAVRRAFDGRIVTVFQPHRYTRTAALLEEFGAAFAAADEVIVTDIFAAGERPLAGIDGSRVHAAIARHGHGAVRFLATLDEAAEALPALTAAGDIVLTLGAGDVWKVGEQFLESAIDRRRSA